MCSQTITVTSLNATVNTGYTGGASMALDANGDVYVTGWTQRAWRRNRDSPPTPLMGPHAAQGLHGFFRAGS